MSRREHRGEWTAFIGIGLVVLGVWLVIENFFGSLVAPLRQIVDVLGRVGWPLALIALGVLLLVATRSRSAEGADARKLYRSRADRMVGGVLGGIAKYTGWQPMTVRVLYVVFAVITGFGPALLLYIIASIAIPEEPFAAQTVVAPTPPPAPPIPPAPAVPPAPPVAPTRPAPPAPPAS